MGDLPAVLAADRANPIDGHNALLSQLLEVGGEHFASTLGRQHLGVQCRTKRESVDESSQSIDFKIEVEIHPQGPSM